VGQGQTSMPLFRSSSTRTRHAFRRYNQNLA